MITRSFEQLDGCIIYNEPFFGAYVHLRKDQFHLEVLPQETRNEKETDYKKVIEKLTGDLPDGKSFSFQKLSTDGDGIQIIRRMAKANEDN